MEDRFVLMRPISDVFVSHDGYVFGAVFLSVRTQWVSLFVVGLIWYSFPSVRAKSQSLICISNKNIAYHIQRIKII